MALWLFEAGRCHLVRLKRIRKTKKTVRYDYLADEDGEWGEICYDCENDTFEIVKLADWDLTVSKPFANRAIQAIRKMLRSNNLAKEALIPWRE